MAGFDEQQGARADLEHGTIAGLVRNAAAAWPDAVAIEDGDTVLTFAELEQHARRAARAYLSRGIERGDCVGIWAPNAARWVVAALGLHLAGGVLVPINTRYRGAEAGYILGRSRAKLLVTVQGFLGTSYVDLLAAADVDLPELRETIVMLGDTPDGATNWDAFLAGADDVDDDALDARIAELSGDDLCDVLFTSGTTGQPKGAMCAHGQTLRAYGDWSAVTGLRAGDRYLVVAPFFHAFGYKAGWLACLLSGATILPQPVFDVDAVLSRIGRDRVSVLPGPPALYQSILGRADLSGFDLSSLRLAVTGAASIPVSLIERMRDRLGFETIITGYGLTEACGIATMCRWGDDPETIATTSGRAIPAVEVSVVDADGASLPAGEQGEVLVRGYNLMRGFFGDEHATAEAIDDDGWLHTGDIGILDERGYLRITDRLKDMFIVGGFNAYPAEIENALAAHDAIAEVAVIGVPDERLGEVGQAWVVLRQGAELGETELIAWARERLANFKVPRSVRVVDALPRNASGKVLKFALRERS